MAITRYFGLLGQPFSVDISNATDLRCQHSFCSYFAYSGYGIQYVDFLQQTPVNHWWYTYSSLWLIDAYCLLCWVCLLRLAQFLNCPSPNNLHFEWLWQCLGWFSSDVEHVWPNQRRDELSSTFRCLPSRLHAPACLCCSPTVLRIGFNRSDTVVLVCTWILRCAGAACSLSGVLDVLSYLLMFLRVPDIWAH